MLRIDWSKDAAKATGRLPPKHAKQIVLKIAALAENPTPPDSQTLKGAAQFRRADQGEYRIIYRHDHEWLRVEMVGKRNDDEVYKRFERKVK